jgi:transposase
MANYKETDKTQGLYLEVNLSDQILPGTFVWTMSTFIDTQADFSGFDLRYNNDMTGVPAIHPRIMLKAVLYGYANGQYSSRKIMKLCKNNITMKALTEDTEPYFTTIARFVSGNKEAVTNLFAEVLYFCNELKLIDGNMFAIDGCKLPTNASKEWSGTLSEFRKKKAKLEKLLAKIITQQKANDKDKTVGELNETCKSYITSKKMGKKRWERIEKKIKKLDDFSRWPTRKPGN